MSEKVEYYTIKIDSQQEMSWVYSAADLQKQLSAAFQGQSLKKLFVSLYGYLDYSKRRDDYLDFSYMGGTLLLVFDHSVLELVIHVEGMMEYRIMPAWEVKIPKQGTVDWPPEDMWIRSTSCYYYNLGQEVAPYCFERVIRAITVNKSDIYPFSLRGWDEIQGKEAEKRGDLPQSIELHMDGGACLYLCGEELEYFYIQFEEEKA